MRRALLIAIAVLVGGCGATRSHSGHRTQPAPAAPTALTPWPTEADYTTITTAEHVRDNALYHQSDWRRKAGYADLALRTLLTVRMAAGSCADYVTQLYGNLRDLQEAYQGENWRPLVRLVRRQRTARTACLQPRSRLAM